MRTSSGVSGANPAARKLEPRGTVRSISLPLEAPPYNRGERVMDNSKSLVRMFTTFAVIAGAVAGLALSSSGALAQVAATEGRHYVMTATGTWGAAQDAAIAAAGGTV